MKIYLTILQCFYFFTFIPWVAIWGVQFTSFDQGIGLWNSLFVFSVTLFPVVVIMCSVLSWVYKSKDKKLSISISLIPFLWIGSFPLILLFS